MNLLNKKALVIFTIAVAILMVAAVSGETFAHLGEGVFGFGNGIETTANCRKLLFNTGKF